MLIALQLPLTHWFYLYLPLFFPFVHALLLLPKLLEAHHIQESRTGYALRASTQSAAKSATPTSPVHSE
jgi:hypothetical protein